MLRAVPAILAVASLAFVALGIFASGGHAQVPPLLVNGDFEVWSADPDQFGWSASGSVTQSPAFEGTGNAATLGGEAAVTQVVPATVGTTYAAEVRAQLAAGSARATLRLQFLDSGFTGIGSAATASVTAGAAQTLSVEAIAPSGASWIAVQLQAEPISGDGAVAFDDASLVAQSDAEPTPTWTFTPTPEDPPTPTPTPRVSPTPRVGGSRVAVPGFEDGVILLPPPGDTLINGTFDSGDGDEPSGWDNFGGIFRWSASGGMDGSPSATLISLTDSTKWAFQVVPIHPGDWYRASAHARVTSGAAVTRISILWYDSVDGSGTSIRSDDGATSDSFEWTALSLGPVRAPLGARSARLRLMVESTFPAAVTFDDVAFKPVDAPHAQPALGEPSQAGAEPENPPRPADGDGADLGPGPDDAATGPVHAQPPKPPRTGFIAQAARSCEVCLTEVLSDPINEGRDAPFEWIELQNRSAAPVDLGGWLIGDSTATDLIPDGTSLAPGEFLVIAGDEALIEPGVRTLKLEDGAIGGGLNNDEDTARLLRADDSLADSVQWGQSSDLPAATSGRTLAFDDAAGEWFIATAGTPGRAGEPPPAPAADVAPTTFEPEPEPSRIPWIILAVSVAAGVFAAPFAVRRLRTGVSRANMGHGH